MSDVLSTSSAQQQPLPMWVPWPFVVSTPAPAVAAATAGSSASVNTVPLPPLLPFVWPPLLFPSPPIAPFGVSWPPQPEPDQVIQPAESAPPVR